MLKQQDEGGRVKQRHTKHHPEWLAAWDVTHLRLGCFMFNQFKLMFFSGLLALPECRNHMKSLGTCHLHNGILPTFGTSSISSSSLHCRPVDAANSCKTPSIFAILATPPASSAVLGLPQCYPRKRHRAL